MTPPAPAARAQPAQPDELVAPAATEAQITDERRAKPVLVYGALGLVQVLFGVNYVVSKVLVQAVSPLVWASSRLFIATGLMAGSAALLRRPHPAKDRKFFVPLIAFALLGTIINQASFLVGLKYTTPTNSAVLNTLIPIFTLMLVTLRGQEKFTLARGLGFVSALAGVLVLRRIDQFSLSDQTAIGDGLTVLNCLSYAFFLSFSKPFLERNDRVWTTAWLFGYGAIGMTLLAIPSWRDFLAAPKLPEFTGTLVGCMIFSVFGGTVATYFLNLWALAHTRSSAVALFIYLQPVVAAAVAWGYFGEAVTARVVASSLFILMGVFLGLHRKIVIPEPERRTENS